MVPGTCHPVTPSIGDRIQQQSRPEIAPTLAEEPTHEI